MASKGFFGVTSAEVKRMKKQASPESMKRVNTKKFTTVKKTKFMM